MLSMHKSMLNTSLNGTATATAIRADSFAYKAGTTGKTLTITFTQNDNASGTVALQAPAMSYYSNLARFRPASRPGSARGFQPATWQSLMSGSHEQS